MKGKEITDLTATIQIQLIQDCFKTNLKKKKTKKEKGKGGISFPFSMGRPVP